MHKKHLVLILLIVLPFLWATLATPSPVRAATITVDSLADNTTADGDCTLREAIQNANDDAATFSDCVAGTGADIIDFGGAAASGTITFTTVSEIFVTDPDGLTIDGGDDIVLDGGGSPAGTRLFTVGGSGDLTLDAITLQNGYSPGSGGAINVQTANSVLTITNSSILNNISGNDGGAIVSSGSLTITDTVFNGNEADDDGGAIYQSSSVSMTVTTSAFINNRAGVVSDADGSSGGAIFHNGALSGPSAISASYFLNNQVDNADNADGGGAIYHGTLGILSIGASIFLGNNADGDDARGGAVYNNSGDDAAMVVNYSHFGEFLGVALPPIPPIVVPGPDFDVVAALGIGSANSVTGTSAVTAGGGAFFNNGYLVMNGVSFIGNTSSNHGGAFANTRTSTDTYPQPLGQEIIISNTTFTLNTATNNGGAIYHNNEDDLLEIRNVTIANNNAASGDGIFNNGDGESVNQSPFDDFYLSNTIIANDSCAGGELGDASALSNNVVFNGACDIRLQDGSSSASSPYITDPILSTPELAFNLGNIFTIVLSLGNGSSASGTGDASICSAFPVLNFDQRNLPLGFRPQGDTNCDIGAYESDQITPPDINVRDNGDTANIADGDAIPDAGDGTDFGTTTIGNPVVRTFIIENTGGANLTVTTPITVPAGYSVTNPVTNPIPGGTQTTFTVTCTATAGGVFSGNVSIASNDPDAENPYTFAITCDVDAPEINVQGAGNTITDGDNTPSATDDTDFGTTPQGSSVTNTFTIQNLGDLSLNVTSITVPAGFSVVSSAPFTITPAGTDVTFDVTCDAVGSGTFAGDVVIANNDSDENPYNFRVTCNVTAVGPEMNVIGNSVSIVDGDNTPALGDDTDFGPTLQGTSTTRTFTIENTGTAALNLTLPITVTGDFSIAALPVTTTPVGSGGGTTTFAVVCDATILGLQTGTVTIQNDDSDENPYTFDVACTVNAPAPEMTVLGNSIVILDGDNTPDVTDDTSLGATTVGTPITSTFTIRNENIATGNLNLTGIAPDYVTVGSTEFSISVQPATTSLAPNATTTFTVQCDADTIGLHFATVLIANDDSDENPYTFDVGCLVNPTAPEIDVRGNGVSIVDGDNTPDLADHTEFVATTIGNPVTRTFTVHNLGTADLTIASTIPLSFTIMPPFPTTPITAGSSTDIIVQCDAPSAATFTGTISITNNDSDENPFTFDIRCVVTDPSAPEIDVRGNGVSIVDGDNTPDLADHTEFAATTVGNPVTRTFTVHNLGMSDLTIASTIPLSFTIMAPFPTTPIAAGSSTDIIVQCDASSATIFTGTISITNNDSDENPFTFDIRCVVTDPAPEMTVLGNSIVILDGDNTPDVTDDTSLGATTLGVPITSTFTIRNESAATANLNLTGIAPDYVTVGSTEFSISVQPGTTSLAPNATTTFVVQCDGDTIGLHFATVLIANDDSDENPYTFDVGCLVNPTAPEMDVTGNAVSIADGANTPNLGDHTEFATTTVGNPVTRTYTIENLGTATLTISGAVTISDTTNFSVSLQPAATINAGADSTFEVTCLAISANTFTATVTINNDDSDENPYTFDVECTVNALSSPEMNVTGNAVTIADGANTPNLGDHTEFVATTVGNPVSRTYTIENTGTANLTITLPITVPAGFTVTAVPSTSVAPSTTTTFTVECTAASANTFSGTVSITNDDSNENPYTFDIECVVNPVPTPEINVTGNAVNIPDGSSAPNFGDHTLFVTTTVGVPTSRTFVVENLGSATLTITSVPALPAPFSITTSPVGTINGSSNANLVIECLSGTAATYNATVTINSDDSDEGVYTFDIECTVATAGTPEINVTGNGNNIANLDTTPVLTDFTDFGGTSVGIPLSRTFFIQNLGASDLTLGAITVPAGFTITTTPASPITAGNNDDLTIECTAAAFGTYAGTVSIVNNDSSENPYEFDITCNVNPVGSNADLSLSKIVSDLTPQFGDIITYTVTVSNVGPGATTNVEVVDIFPTSVTFLSVTSTSQGSVVVDGSNTFLTWTIGTMTNPSTVTLTYQVQVNPTIGTTENYAEVTVSDAPDPNSTPGNGVPPTPLEDDEAAIAFLFDPPFGRKIFTEAGVNILEWTIIWVNPSNSPLNVIMEDPLLAGTTFIPGSLVCTTFGASTQTNCAYDAGFNMITFAGEIAPNPGATLADTLTASNRVEIVYRVQIPDNVTVVPNTATLSTELDDVIVITETYTRTITPPPTNGGGTTLTTEEIQAKVTALPATGEAPWWADPLRAMLLALIPITLFVGVGGMVWFRRARNK